MPLSAQAWIYWSASRAMRHGDDETRRIAARTLLELACREGAVAMRARAVADEAARVWGADAA